METVVHTRTQEQKNKMYIYLGDRMTDESLKGKECIAVKRGDKCIRAKSKMLVEFETGKCIVLARRLRKIQ